MFRHSFSSAPSAALWPWPRGEGGQRRLWLQYQPKAATLIHNFPALSDSQRVLMSASVKTGSKAHFKLAPSPWFL